MNGYRMSEVNKLCARSLTRSLSVVMAGLLLFCMSAEAQNGDPSNSRIRGSLDFQDVTFSESDLYPATKDVVCVSPPKESDSTAKETIKAIGSWPIGAYQQRSVDHMEWDSIDSRADIEDRVARLCQLHRSSMSNREISERGARAFACIQTLGCDYVPTTLVDEPCKVTQVVQRTPEGDNQLIECQWDGSSLNTEGVCRRVNCKGESCQNSLLVEAVGAYDLKEDCVLSPQ